MDIKQQVDLSGHINKSYYNNIKWAGELKILNT